jgi:hypothetical protein
LEFMSIWCNSSNFTAGKRNAAGAVHGLGAVESPFQAGSAGPTDAD